MSILQQYTIDSHEDEDPESQYLVLRLDKQGDDDEWSEACRLAARVLARHLLYRDIDPDKAMGILHACDKIETE